MGDNDVTVLSETRPLRHIFGLSRGPDRIVWTPVRQRLDKYLSSSCYAHVVVAVAVMVLSPDKGWLMLLHLSVMFLSMAFARLVSIQPSK